jgi:hypothetical protein
MLPLVGVRGTTTGRARRVPRSRAPWPRDFPVVGHPRHGDRQDRRSFSALEPGGDREGAVPAFRLWRLVLSSCAWRSRLSERELGVAPSPPCGCRKPHPCRSPGLSVPAHNGAVRGYAPKRPGMHPTDPCDTSPNSRRGGGCPRQLVRNDRKAMLTRQGGRSAQAIDRGLSAVASLRRGDRESRPRALVKVPDRPGPAAPQSVMGQIGIDAVVGR